MPKISKKNIQRLIKKKIHKKVKNNNSKASTYNYNGYYQNLYSNYLRDSAKEAISKRNANRDPVMDDIKYRINLINNNPLFNYNPQRYPRVFETRDKMRTLYNAYENQKEHDQQRASDLHVGNNLANPIARDLRERDDQRLYGNQIYINSAKPNYEEFAKQVTASKMKNANKDMIYSTKETLDNILLALLNR